MTVHISGVYCVRKSSSSSSSTTDYLKGIKSDEKCNGEFLGKDKLYKNQYLVNSALNKINQCKYNYKIKKIKKTLMPPSGYRYLYVDELLNNNALKIAATNKLGDWDIVEIVNGWTEGKGYGRAVVQDCGKRALNNQILVISACYPPNL